MDRDDIQKEYTFILIYYVIEMVINGIYSKKIQLKFNRSKLMLIYW